MKNTKISGHDHGFDSKRCPGYQYEILHERNVIIILLQHQGNPEHIIDQKVAKHSRRHQKDRQRAAQNISHLRDEVNIFAIEHIPILTKQLHFYPQESRPQMRDIGGKYCGL